MCNKLKIVILILSSLVVIISLAACTSTKSGGTPAPSQAIPASGAPSGLPGAGQMPSGAPRAGQIPSGAPGGPSGFPGNNGGQTVQQTINLPNQTSSVVGNGAVSVETYANLYFGSAGKIASVNVKQGDHVVKGAVLAKLDTASLELTLAQAKNNVDQAQAKINKAQQTLLQDQQNLVRAQQNLNAQKDVQDIQTKIDNYNAQLQQAKVMLQQNLTNSSSNDYKYWNDLIVNLSVDTNPSSTNSGRIPDGGQIGVLQKQMTKLLEDPANAGVTLVSSATSATEIQQYTLAVQIAQQQITADQADQTVNQSNLVVAKDTLSLDQAQLDQAMITAPFDGLIAKVNARKGDRLPDPSQSQNPVIYMIDPGTIQLDIYVSELDMPLAKIKQKASVHINAFPDSKIDGVVTAISPVSTTLGGVIYYNVTVSFSVPSGIDVRIGMNGSATLSSQ